MNTKKKTTAPARPGRKQRNATTPAAPVATQPTTPPGGKGNGKAVLSIRIPPALLDAARNACFYTPGLTLAALVESSLAGQIQRMEAARGKPFEKRNADIPRGRRIT